MICKTASLILRFQNCQNDPKFMVHGFSLTNIDVKIGALKKISDNEHEKFLKDIRKLANTHFISQKVLVHRQLKVEFEATYDFVLNSSFYDDFLKFAIKNIEMRIEIEVCRLIRAMALFLNRQLLIEAATLKQIDERREAVKEDFKKQQLANLLLKASESTKKV